MVNDSGCPPDDVFLALKDGDDTVAIDHAHIQQCDYCQRRLKRLEAEIVYLREFESAVAEGDTVGRAGSATVAGSGSNGSDRDDPGAARGFRPPQPQSLGRFRLIRLLGKGAFGEVYLAHDPQLDRKVAIKVARRGMLNGQKKVDRFQREARSAAQLHHPYIIPVYDVGQDEDVNYIVYEYVPGETLGAVLESSGKLEPRDAAQLIARLAGALDYAHSLGIVHRDIKPENILIDAVGEPHIADFGLAYRDDGENTRTGDGVVVGTPAYMSPEQARGQGRNADARADIWSLGVLLQEVLTGERPFAGSLKSLLDSIQTTAPKPIVDRSIPADLVAICQTCLAKHIDDRYATAAVLQDDLQRWCRGEPVRVRPLGGWGRTCRWAQRNPTMAALTATVFLVLLVGVVSSSFFAWRAQQKAQLARAEQRDRALAQVGAIRSARSASIPLLVESLRASRADVVPRLRAQLEQTEVTEKERVRLRLALVSLSDSQPDHDLLDQLRGNLTSAAATEFLTVRRLLEPYGRRLKNDLWMLALHREDVSSDARFRAQCALALYDPQAKYWENMAEDVVEKLLGENPWNLAQWGEALHPVRERLLPHVKTAYLADSSERQLRAAMVLAEMFADRVDLLVELVLLAQPRQLPPLLPKLQSHRVGAEARLAIALGTQDAPQSIDSRQPTANAALAMLHLGHPELVWPLLRYSPDPGLRTRLIHSFGPAEIEPRQIKQQLFAEADPAVMSALILSLGEYRPGTFLARERAALGTDLLRLYRVHPHAGVHSALEWLLSKWGFADELSAVDAALVAREASSERAWYVNRHGQTMIVLPGPVTFRMGSPETEADRSNDDERLHRRQIPRSFAIATTEVTLREFQKFRELAYPLKYSPDPQCPVVNVNWYDAVAYCRWLSEQEGIPEEQMCFPPLSQIDPAEEPFPVHLDRSGYRLPTAAEWEYACRAGTLTSRHFGEGEEMLAHYAWYNANSHNRTWPVGRQKPNDFGLFDVYGNATEWCQNLFFHEYPDPVDGVVVDQSDARRGYEYELRGGDFLHAPSVTRSAWRDFQLPGHISYVFGFRVARTVPAN